MIFFVKNLDPIGGKISKRYSSYKFQLKFFRHLLNFVLNGPHKITFGIFLNLKIEIFTIFFINMGSNGSENFQTLLLLQITAKHFQTCPEFSSQWYSQNYVGDFCNFELMILTIFFREF